MQHIQRLRAQARAICDLAQKGHRQLTKAERSEVDALIDQITVAKKVEEAAGKLGCGETTAGGDLYSAVTSAGWDRPDQDGSERPLGDQSGAR
jgi:hypothetical protein